jgi:putative membrane protein
MAIVFGAAGRSGGDWLGSWGWGFGWPWLGVLWLVFAVLFWGGLIALLVWAVRASAGWHRAPRTHDDAREVLRRRLAAGEISEEEYERIRRLLWE